jgi:hypothetical protein
MRWMLVLCASVISAATPPDPAGWQSLYREDFERGVLSGWTDPLEHFQVVKEGNNSVLAGEAHAKLILKDGFWRDYRFKARVKLVDQTQIWLSFRDTQCGSYSVNFDPGGMRLTRMLGCYNHSLVKNRDAAYEIGRW